MFLQKLNEVLSSRKSFIQDKLNFVSIAVALLINIIHWVILLIKIKPGNENILLHYNVIYGADFIDKSKLVYGIPLIALIFFIINLFLAFHLHKRETALPYFLNFASIAIQVVFLTASIVIITA